MASLLVLSTISFTAANGQVNLNARGLPTILTLDDLPAKVRIGDIITLTGTLATVDGKPAEQVTVKIQILTSEPQLITLGSALTDKDGMYQVTWKVRALETNKLSNDVTKKLPTQVASIFAQFDGDETYAASKSAKSTVSIGPNMMKVFISTDKNAYKEGETALVFINFIDGDDRFVDPDNIKADYTYVNQTSTSMSLKESPHIPIGDDLEKKKVGSYTYITPPHLKQGIHKSLSYPLRITIT